MNQAYVCLILMMAGLSCGDQEVTEVDAGEAESLITVQRDDEEVDLVLETLTTNGAGRVVMAEVLTAAYEDGVLSDYRCDFVASDGFRTSSRGDGCEPIDCSQTVDAFIAVETRDVTWEPALNMRGCYQPTGLSRIEMATAAGE